MRNVLKIMSRSSQKAPKFQEIKLGGIGLVAEKQDRFSRKSWN